jgi:hypothetical protein
LLRQGDVVHEAWYRPSFSFTPLKPVVLFALSDRIKCSSPSMLLAAPPCVFIEGVLDNCYNILDAFQLLVSDFLFGA